MTQYVGFPHYGDEYKVMGLAPYGKPLYVDQLSQVVQLLPDGSFELNLKFFKHASEQVVSTWDGGEPTKPTDMFTSALEELLGPARKKGEPLEQKHKDLARSVQATYERAFFPPPGGCPQEAPRTAPGAGGRLCIQLGRQRQDHPQLALQARLHSVRRR